MNEKTVTVYPSEDYSVSGAKAESMRESRLFADSWAHTNGWRIVKDRRGRSENKATTTMQRDQRVLDGME